MKKIFLVLIVVIVLVAATTSVAFAAGPGAAGQGYGNGYANASERGTYCSQLDPDELAQFKADRLEQYKERLDAAVERGVITQEQADAYYAAKEAAMESCDGSGDCTAQGTGCLNGSGANGACGGTGYGYGCGGGRGLNS